MVEAAAVYLPEHRAQELRSIPAFYTNDALTHHIEFPRNCSYAIVHLVKPRKFKPKDRRTVHPSEKNELLEIREADPEVILHEFAHYVFECKIPQEKREQFAKLVPEWLLMDGELKYLSDLSAVGEKTKNIDNKELREAALSQYFVHLYSKHIFHPEEIKDFEREAAEFAVKVMKEK